MRPHAGTEERETGRSLRARLHAFAEGRPLPLPEMIPPLPPPDPFSSTGCVRIGEPEALALNHPLFTRFEQFSLYAPPDLDCTRSADALTCRLPGGGGAVRLDAGTRIGGFRVGPWAARLELKDDSIRCGREGDQ